jgi:hypothetical protein
MNPPTPWPPEMATGENPPDGAIIDYYLGPNFSGVVTLEVLDSKGEVVTRYRSTDPVPPLDPRYPVPTLWARPPRMLSAQPGHHRFLWDMHYPEVPGMSMGPDADQAVPHNTPSVENSPWVLPGNYTVRLIAGGKTQTQPISVVMDPRVKTPPAELSEQFQVSMAIYGDVLKATTAVHEITVLRDQLKAKTAPGAQAGKQAGEGIKGPTQGGSPATPRPAATIGESLETNLDKIAGGRGAGNGGGGRGGPVGPPTLSSVRVQLARIEHSIQNADVQPTEAQKEAYAIAAKPLAGLLEQWDQVKKTQLKALNEELRREHIDIVRLDTERIDHDVEDQVEIGDVE